jgi:hypothetical protein
MIVQLCYVIAERMDHSFHKIITSIHEKKIGIHLSWNIKLNAFTTRVVGG